MVNTDGNIVVTSCGEVRWKGDHDCWSAVHHPHIKLTESHMDETCRGNHEWTFELNSTYKRAPRGGIEFCKQRGCLNELTQTQVQGECEYGASFNPDGRLLWKAHVANWRESSIPTLDRVKFVHAPMNVDQIFGVMHQDGLPKRAIRTARRLFFVYYADHGDHRCRTRADRVFCKNWTAHRRNEFLKEFGDYLPLPVLLLARRLRTQKRWRRFCMDRDYRRSPKKLLKSYPREYRGKLKALVADIRTLDPEVWHRDWNLKRRHELAFEYGRFLTRKQVQRLLACPEHPRSSK